MRSEVSEKAHAQDAVRDALRGQKPRADSPSEGRAMIAVAPAVRDNLRALADSAGTSIGDYIAATIAQHGISEPTRLFDTAALRQAKPLTDLSYRLARLIEALQSSDIGTALQFASEARSIVADALAPLARSHRTEIAQQDGRLAGGWKG
ncbi:MAG TPA: hypothetical protein VFO29_11880 [Candidatus Rubrimentiphilum sp.]|nr:hypothetical protein [Candidatus Rubrimentiphilum sp.]